MAAAAGVVGGVEEEGRGIGTRGKRKEQKGEKGEATGVWGGGVG